MSSSLRLTEAYIEHLERWLEEKNNVLEIALELIDLERDGRSLGKEFPESRKVIVEALNNG